MTPSPTTSATTDDRGTCRHCPASREGCQARQAARYGRCCRACTHGPYDDGRATR